jgi:hypothetical protein
MLVIVVHCSMLAANAGSSLLIMLPQMKVSALLPKRAGH